MMRFKPTLSRPQKWIAALVFAASFLLQTPARLIGLALPSAVKLHDVSGSFWNGKAAALGLGGLIVQEQLEWNFQPGRLLAGALVWDIRGRFGDHASQLRLTLAPERIEADGVRIALPIEPFAAMVPQLKSMPLGGVLTIEAARLDRRTSLTARLDAQQVFSPLAGSGALGNYRADIGNDGNASHWQLTTISGRLQLRGQGTLERTGMPHGQLSFETQSDIPGISALLGTLPRKDGNQFQWSF
ncbi:type II secretion system protein N [Propionivibrio dicarboxylicus]|uniref:Type II secretion system protein N n=1 Tax=Propionivibrio dicarboxylicus TaxID=83767 RepID=A0A1G8ALI6_9RHOO|nr:type II secretion system protein N [Propionivibrio dicarboxylicus]SDH21636.1 Type II secretion system (T2SS), protein N [Propionivibrio dicarboxylicus]